MIEDDDLKELLEQDDLGLARQFRCGVADLTFLPKKGTA